MKLEKLSASSIRDWRTSPKLFYYRHLLRLKLPSKQMPLLFGGAIHAGIEEYYKKKHNGLADALVAFEKEFDIEQLDDEEKLQYAEMFEEGTKLLEMFHEEQPYLQTVWDISPRGRSERYFRDKWLHPLTHRELGVSVNGFIDRETYAGDIVEFKTSKKPYKQEDIDEMVQPTIYAHAYLQRHGRLPNRIIYVVLIKGRKRAHPLQVLETRRTINDFIQLFDEMEVIKKEVANNNFPRGNTPTFFNDEKIYEELVDVRDSKLKKQND